MTAYLEPLSTLQSDKLPLPVRNTSFSILKAHPFPSSTCSNLIETFATDTPPCDVDPYLPWLHDVFPSNDGKHIHFIAQNKRRCHTGHDNLQLMKFMEAQVALFQPVAVKEITNTEEESIPKIEPDNRHDGNHKETRYRLASYDDADSDKQETRFICSFHTHPFPFHHDNNTTINDDIIDIPTQPQSIQRTQTLSTYAFNYEYVNYRKQYEFMLRATGTDMDKFWLSQLLFTCPVPEELQSSIRHGRHVRRGSTSIPRAFEKDEPLSSTTTTSVFVDLIPIRTPVRWENEFFFHQGHAGKHVSDKSLFDPHKVWGKHHILPKIIDSGRWANIPICLSPQLMGLRQKETNRKEREAEKEKKEEEQKDGTNDNKEREEVTSHSKDFTTLVTDNDKPPHRLVACTWTSAYHYRRGSERLITDNMDRLREWIAFHLLVGFDHFYIYDNTNAAHAVPFVLENGTVTTTTTTTAKTATTGGVVPPSSLQRVTDLFPEDKVTLIKWPHKICNNNRPAHDDPGERSSQYAAESSCRVRYGNMTEWMASIDIDEYLIPMGNHTSWKTVLDLADRQGGLKVLKFRSARAKPRVSHMEPYFDEEEEHCSAKSEPLSPPQICLAPRKNETFLSVYDCEYVKPPKSEKFERAQKQLYRSDYVLSHFVHYSTVTKDIAQTKEQTPASQIYSRRDHHKLYKKAERLLNEFEEGVMVHAKTTVPLEAFYSMRTCAPNARGACNLGYACPDDLPYDTERQKKKLFKNNATGEFCNCWINRKVEEYYVPKLEKALQRVGPLYGPNAKGADVTPR